jgi:hypothetical protein
MERVATAEHSRLTGAAAMRPDGRSTMAIRLWIWAAWATVFLSAYYLQLWTALASPGQPAFDYDSSLAAFKHSAVLAIAATAVAAVALPTGALLEVLFGWPRLPFAWSLPRRVASGTLALLVVLGPLHAPVGTLVQAIAGAWLPFAGEAASRNLAGLFGSILVVAAAQPAGQVVCRWLGWRPDSWQDELLYYTSAGLGVIAAGCGMLAAVGLFRPRAVQLLVIAILVAGLPRLWTMLRRAGWWAQAQAPPETLWFRRGLQLVSAGALAAAFLTALAPEKEYDALWYHLGLPKIWLEAGRPVDLVHEYVSLYPLQWELVFTAGLVFGGAVSAKLLHFICLPLGALLAWQLSRTLAPRAEPWVAVALFLTVPTVLWESTTAYVDLALAIHVGLGVLALLRWVDGGGRGWFGLAVVMLGLAMAIKHLALVAVAILAPGLVLWLWRQERWPLQHAIAPVALLVALALIIPLPWHLRAWLASGNPFFPELYGIVGASPPERWDSLAERGLSEFKARFGVARTPLNLIRLPWDMTIHAARYGGTLGPLFLMLLPALALFRGATTRLAWLAWFAALFIGRLGLADQQLPAQIPGGDCAAARRARCRSGAPPHRRGSTPGRDDPRRRAARAAGAQPAAVHAVS